MKLSKKTIIVTAPTSSIGKQLISNLADENVTLVLVGRDLRKLKSVQKILVLRKIPSYIFRVDLTNSKDVLDTVSKISNKFKKIDGIVNLAGHWHDESSHFFGIDIEKTPNDLIEYNLDLLKGTILFNKGLIKKLSNKSTIIGMSGSFSKKEQGVLAEYILKKGTENLITQFHYDLFDKGVYSYSFSPRYVWTDHVQKHWPELKDECLTVEDVSKKIVSLLKNRPKGQSGKVIPILKS